jgi:hypothetical protein
LDTLPPVEAPLFRREVAAGRAVGWARREDEVTVRGAAEAGVEPGEEDVMAGEGVRAAPIEGGPDGLLSGEGVGAFDFSLSHEEKKSSVSMTGVDEASGVSSRPSMWMPWG